MDFIFSTRGKKAPSAVVSSNFPPLASQGEQPNAQSVESLDISSAKKTFPVGLKMLHEPPEQALVEYDSPLAETSTISDGNRSSAL
jgi:hypothetical protein